MSFDTPTPGYNASDPTATYLNISCLDLLLIEMVPLAERMARRAEEALFTNTNGTAGTTAAAGAGAAAGDSLEGAEGVGAERGRPRTGTVGGSEAGTGTGTGTGTGDQNSSIVGEDVRDAVCARLDAWGYRVGQGLSERFSRDRPRLLDNLDVIKFVCKDLWTILFKKQIDNLKTNHRGVYVLTDNTFRPFLRMSLRERGEAVRAAQPHLHFPAGLIRGALATLGIATSVQADCAELPQAVFQIKTLGGRA